MAWLWPVLCALDPYHFFTLTPKLLRPATVLLSPPWPHTGHSHCPLCARRRPHQHHSSTTERDGKSQPTHGTL